MTTTTNRSRAGRSSVFQCGCSVSTLRSPSESWLSGPIAHIVAWNRATAGGRRAGLASRASVQGQRAGLASRASVRVSGRARRRPRRPAWCPGRSVRRARPVSSTSVAVPASTAPPGSSTRTSRPTVTHQRRYSVRRPAGSGQAVHAVYRLARSVRIAASRRSRSRQAASSRSSEVAVGTGSSARVRVTLSPTPATTALPCASARIPAILRPFTSTSLGHFRVAMTPASARNAAATAIPVTSGSQARAAGATVTGRSSTENTSAARGGLDQDRPSGPGPRSASRPPAPGPRPRPPGPPPAGRRWWSRFRWPPGCPATGRRGGPAGCRGPRRRAAAAAAPPQKGP